MKERTLLMRLALAQPAAGPQAGTSHVPMSSCQSVAAILAALMIRNLLRYTWFCAAAVL